MTCIPPTIPDVLTACAEVTTPVIIVATGEPVVPSVGVGTPYMVTTAAETPSLPATGSATLGIELMLAVCAVAIGSWFVRLAS